MDLLPLVDCTRRVHQVVHVAVPVRLRQQPEGIFWVSGEAAVVVCKAGDLLLLEQRDLQAERVSDTTGGQPNSYGASLRWLHTEVVLRLEQGVCACQGVLGDHDCKRQLDWLARELLRSLLQREDRRDVELQVRLLRADLVRKRHLNPREAKTLSQPSSDKHERATSQLRLSYGLMLRVRGGAKLKRGSRRDRRNPSLQRVGPSLGVCQEFARVCDVGGEPPRVGGVELFELRVEARLVRVLLGQRGPAISEVRLPQLDEKRGNCHPHLQQAR